MPGARRRRHSGRHRAHDELFGPPTGRPIVPGIGANDAIARAERLLAADPHRVEPRLALARLFERVDRPDLALGALDEGLARVPDETELLLARGRLQGQRRRYAEAEADLRRVLRLHPSHGPAHFELGLVLIRRGRTADAATAFTQAVAFGPESAPTYTELAEALNQSGRLIDAATALERAIALDPGQSRAYNLLGRVLDRLGRSDEATRMYRRARELAGQ